RIGGVLPEIAQAFAQEADAGDAVGGRQNGLGLLTKRLIATVAGQGGQRLFILGGDEGARFGAVHLFQRQMVVGGLDPLGRQVAREVRRRGRRRGGGRIGHGALGHSGRGGQHQGRQGDG